jgi:protoporphyrinogen oxidase
MIKSLCVLGGGNAGLMMALFLRASFSKLKITIVKSDKIREAIALVIKRNS